MPVRYALYANHLTSDPDDHYGKIQSAGTRDTGAIADLMIARGTKFKKQEILGLIADLSAAMLESLKDGYDVILEGVGSFEVEMSGVFPAPDTSFNPALGHQLLVAANIDETVLRTFRDQAVVEKQATFIPSPAPVVFKDAGSGTSNATITPNNIGELTGSSLKFDPEAVDEGIFFVPSGQASGNRVVTVNYNKPGRLMFLNPHLTPGDYHIEVRARLRGVKELRVGRLKKLLTAV